jgi:hypothetical protein
MPVIVTSKTGAVWIDPNVNDPEALQALLKPFPAEETAFHEVSRLVNNPRNNRPELALPVARLTANDWPGALRGRRSLLTASLRGLRTVEAIKPPPESIGPRQLSRSCR